MATFLLAAPVIDGDVLNDRAWNGLEPATGFLQIQARRGRPRAIIVSDSRRDASLDDSDSFQMIIDECQDQQNGLLPGTNPVGIQYDGQLVKEYTGFSSASGAGFNLNWYAPWEVVACIGALLNLDDLPPY